LQRNRGADNPGAEHDRIGACHDSFLLPHLYMDHLC
jgi:hypothetical protein